jgi:CHAD domain-containing protein
MANVLKRDERPSAGIRRIAGKKASIIRRYLEQADGNDTQAEQIHRVRMAIKKLRALLRLVRGALPEKRYRQEQQALRAVAKVLAPLRDADVLARVLPKLQRHIPARDFAFLQRAFVKEREKQATLLWPAQKAVQKKCGPALRKIGDWPLKGFKKRGLRDGMKRTCQKFYEAQKQAEKALTAENLHNWRKCAKDLAFQLNLICRIGPKSAAKRAEQLTELGQYLGTDHDLVLFEEKVGAFPAVAKKLEEGFRRRHAKIRRAAFKLGGTIHGRRIRF